MRITAPFVCPPQLRHCRRFEEARGKIPSAIWSLLHWLAWYGLNGADAGRLASDIGTSESWVGRYVARLRLDGLAGFTVRRGERWYWITKEGAEAVALLDSIGERG